AILSLCARTASCEQRPPTVCLFDPTLTPCLLFIPLTDILCGFELRPLLKGAGTLGFVSQSRLCSPIAKTPEDECEGDEIRRCRRIRHKLDHIFLEGAPVSRCCRRGIVSLPAPQRAAVM